MPERPPWALPQGRSRRHVTVLSLAARIRSASTVSGGLECRPKYSHWLKRRRRWLHLFSLRLNSATIAISGWIHRGIGVFATIAAAAERRLAIAGRERAATFARFLADSAAAGRLLRVHGARAHLSTNQNLGDAQHVALFNRRHLLVDG
jgi:hypothetical protein